MTLVLTPAAYLVFVSDNTDIFIRLTLGAALTSRHIFSCNLYHLITPPLSPPSPHMRCNEDTHSSSWRHTDRGASGWDQADQRFHQKLINDWVISLSAACWARPNLSERHRRRQTPDLHRPALPSQNRFVQVSSSRAGSSAGAGVVAARAPLPCPLAASWSPLTSSLYPRAPSLHAGACLASVLATSAVSPGAARRGSCGQCGARCAVRPGIQRTPVAVWPSRRKHGRGLRRDLDTGIVIL